METIQQNDTNYGRFDRMIDKLVRYRHSNDANLTGRGYARHSCAIFVEENQSCLKHSINWIEPPELQLCQTNGNAISISIRC